jgi:molybdopterin molybdotransferase
MKKFIGFNEALDLTLSALSVIGTESLPLAAVPGRVLAEDIIAMVDSPTIDASLKDGYAVVSEDVAEAGSSCSVNLKLMGNISAGNLQTAGIKNGQAMRITTGGSIPQGASAVLSEEFCEQTEDEIVCYNTAKPGRNILWKGSDIRKGETIAKRGDRLSPALIGLIVCSGVGSVMVYKLPRVLVIATGDEIIAPGESPAKGKLYASNMMETCAWLSCFGFPFQAEMVGDSKKDIKAVIQKHLPHVDAFITSGGIWGSEKDFLLNVLEELNWRGIYHRVRLGPGKGIGFGLLEKKPVFSLPGGPPSHEIAFLQLALPGLMAMKGDHTLPFPVATANLTETVRGDKSWTQFIHAGLDKKSGRLFVSPLKQKSRLKSMAEKQALIIIPEGREELCEGEEVDIQVI